MRRFKVVLIGDSDVGKSSTFIRFRDGKFDDYIQSTIGLDFATREVSFQVNEDDPETETKTEIQLWDTAGLERAGRMTSNYYNFSHAVILMYDVTDTTTMNNLEMWYDNAKNDSNNTNTIYFLVGNKIDETPGEIQVSEGDACRFAKESLKIDSDKYDVTYRISAKTGNGLNDLFQKITHILSGCSKQPAEKLDNTITDLTDAGREKDKCGC